MLVWLQQTETLEIASSLSHSQAHIKLHSSDLTPPWEIASFIFDIKHLAALFNFNIFWVNRMGVSEAHNIVNQVFYWARSGVCPTNLFPLFPIS